MHKNAQIAIIGGGYAGCAAAVRLIELGYTPTLFEASHILGGRARRVKTPTLGHIDNGQHLLLGAYQTTLNLIEKVHQKPAQDFFEILPLAWDIPQHLSFYASPHYGAPFHLLAGLFQSKTLTFQEKMALSLFFLKVKFGQKIDPSWSVVTWLHHWTLPERLRTLLIFPLCIAALNTPPEQASAWRLSQLLRESLLSLNANDSHYYIPRCDLSTLFPEQAAHWIQARGGKIYTQARVHTVTCPSEKQFSVSVQQDEHLNQYQVSHLIYATAPYHLAHILPKTKDLETLSHDLAQLQYAPICTIYLQYNSVIWKKNQPKMRMLPPHCTGQWFFFFPQQIRCVISTFFQKNQTKAELVQTIIHEMKTYFQIEPEPITFQVIHEKRATFLCSTTHQPIRTQTALNNLYIAGDYLHSHYPATLESAVQSGWDAANLLHENFKG